MSDVPLAERESWTPEEYRRMEGERDIAVATSPAPLEAGAFSTWPGGSWKDEEPERAPLDPIALAEELEGWDCTLGEAIDQLRLELKHTHFSPSYERRGEIIARAVMVDSIGEWRDAIGKIERLVAEENDPALASASEAERARIDAEGHSAAELEAERACAAIEGRPPVLIVPLLFPMRFGETVVEEIRLRAPSYGEIERLTTGKTTRLELVATMAGITTAELRSLRYPDAERVFGGALDQIPDFARGR